MVEKALTELFDRPAIALSRPLPDGFWLRAVSDDESTLSKKGGDEYQRAVAAQAEQCAQIFRLPLSVVSGRAGTGKTTIIRAIVKGIRRSEEHTSELQSLMRISYAVFCLKKTTR